jgi:orotate phosphoribosyltransferase
MIDRYYEAMTTETVMTDQRLTEEQVLKLFTESGALLNGHFKLTSGRHSDVYYEKFEVLKNPNVCTPLCKEMAALFAEENIQTVVGPTTGGILIAYVVAETLGVNALYAEAGEDNKRIFKRGFSLEKGERVLIVDDVVTTGRSLFEVSDLVESYDAEVVGYGALLDRSGEKVDFKYPLKALTRVDAETWDPADCPMCGKGEEITQRGSRKF